MQATDLTKCPKCGNTRIAIVEYLKVVQFWVQHEDTDPHVQADCYVHLDKNGAWANLKYICRNNECRHIWEDETLKRIYFVPGHEDYEPERWYADGYGLLETIPPVIKFIEWKLKCLECDWYGNIDEGIPSDDFFCSGDLPRCPECGESTTLSHLPEVEPEFMKLSRSRFCDGKFLDFTSSNLEEE